MEPKQDKLFENFLTMLSNPTVQLSANNIKYLLSTDIIRRLLFKTTCPITQWTTIINISD